MSNLFLKSACASVAWLLSLAGALAAPTPEWLWHDNKGVPPANGELRYFRKTFTPEGQVTRALLAVVGDNHVVAYVNGQRVASSDDWQHPAVADVATHLKPGENLLAVSGRNDGGSAGVLARLELSLAGGRKQLIVSDRTWLSAAQVADGWEKAAETSGAWSKPVSLGKLGTAPWGNVLDDKAPARRAAAGTRVATPVEKITVPQGFKVELVHSATKEEGSWVCLTVDTKGRLIVSPQGSEPMLRLTLTKQGAVAKREKIDLHPRSAMGLLYAFDSLYVNGKGQDGLALYRLRDTDGDDQFDHVEMIRKWTGDGGEHGPHGVTLGPDNKLYVVNGNFVQVPSDALPTSPHRNYADDVLLPRAEDGNGFGAGRKPPGGYVVRLDPDGRNCELLAAGQRNAYDIAFNADGELFTFDSDMEWDWGTPWYRPIRVLHVVSGADHGFREGTAKWPVWYPDSLPATCDIGIGSPTGVKFGTGSKFPPKYRRAFFIMDWSYKRILAVHLTPQGASYTGTIEPFVVGAPNPTDLEFGADGAMYFLTGGRGTQTGLYRVSYAGPTVREKRKSKDELRAEQAATAARALRRKLETFHGNPDPAALDIAWPHLDSPDRWIRYAARIAVERQPVEQWQDRALAERRVNASLTALLALARCGAPAVQETLMEALGDTWGRCETEEQKIEALRVAQVCFARLGRPGEEVVSSTIRELDPAFPTPSPRLNREIAQLLIYLEAPGIARKCLDLVAKAPTQEEQLFYIFHLRTLKSGWTLADRRAWFHWFQRDRAQDRHADETLQWFKDAGRGYGDGASFPKFMANFRKDAAATFNEAERAELDPLVNPQLVGNKLVIPNRPVVKEWTTDDLLPALDQAGRGRSFRQGKAAFELAQCLACHRFGNEGGAVGPDLTAVASRFSRRDILESLLDPSKVISEQYQNITVVKKDDDEVTGRLVEETDDALVIVTNPLTGDRVTVRQAHVARRAASKISPMPEGLLNTFTKEEILDLLAYLESGGSKEHAAFSRR
jgi:putative heme-binding domain-containing protein